MEDKITPEQEKEIVKAMKAHMIGSFFLFVKYLFFILACAFGTAMVNTFYVKSESFAFMATLVNVIFLMHFMLQESAARRATYDAKMLKILYPEGEKK